ncbi:hypothetical protein V6C53_17570 [Desulfocurvibacter africanus]|uniref:hypothetical protein n=1 Tax=Desulfocurvibacter africanus TaxID=873 RepID=UPI002FDB7CD7
MTATRASKTSWKQRLSHELAAYGLNVLYLFILFGLFTWYRRLLLAEYEISYLHYGISLIKALVLAKVIMIGDILGLGRRLEDKPLIYPTLYKTAVFGLWVAVFSVFEHMADGWLRGQGPTAGLDELLREGKYKLLAHGLIIFFAFLPFFAARELDRRLGKGRMIELFFRRAS